MGKKVVERERERESYTVNNNQTYEGSKEWILDANGKQQELVWIGGEIMCPCMCVYGCVCVSGGL